jgi:predicted permease
MSGNTSTDVLEAEDHATRPGQVPPLRRYKFVAPGFFHTMGRRFLAGRDFNWTDSYSFRDVAIISENFAREYWVSPANAIGKRVRENKKDDWREIVGVVANEYDDGVQKKPSSVVYWPLLTKKFWGQDVFVQRSAVFTIRSPRSGSVAFLKDVQHAVWSVLPDTPIASARTMKELYNKSMARISFTLVMLSIAGAMSLILGLVGIYGVVSYSVSQRTREIGIRMALGAKQQQVSSMFLRQGLTLSAVGVLFGGLAALGLTRFMSSFVFAVSTQDPYTFALMITALIAAAIGASYFPALRATTVDPVETLRSE